MNDVAQDTAPRQLLVDMLREAAKLEHCLLNAYLAAACSVKSTPQEFATIDGMENRRRAVQFERVRAWKQAMMGVAHEEMRHLHFVECMLRALGERACLDLPARTKDGAWIIPNWRIQLGSTPFDEAGATIPVRPLDLANIKRFVLYESTDSLQDENPFEGPATELFQRLHAFEFDLHLEGMLVAMPDGPDKTALKAKLHHIYEELTPLDRPAPTRLAAEAAALPELDQLRFQSIADFYLRGVLPLYEQAFDSHWVVNNDRNLVDEQLNPDYAAEGFLPIGPVGRSLSFQQFESRNQKEPLSDYRSVEDIVKEIVEEGEGASLFRVHAEHLLAKIDEIGVGGFLKALAQDKAGANDPSYNTPPWLAEAQLLRKSHLYVFAMIMVEYQQEERLAESCGTRFEAARQVPAATSPGLPTLVRELPLQFNACYLAMLAWLSRMYEPKKWVADMPRRLAIEMIATWPLMSLAIRPFLELGALFPVDWNQFFRIDRDGLPMLPIWAQELLLLWESDDRSGAITERMDYLAVRTLRAAADWAREQAWAVDGSNLPDQEKGLIRTRLMALTRLAEFERQYPYRVAGGYSNRSPDLSYQNTHKDNARFSENPSFGETGVAFANNLVLRLRFRGWGLVQLATDPDPPSDEAGCSGTLMLHAADGDRRFDRALVWQNFEPGRNIFRAVQTGGSSFGVNVIEASLLAPDLASGASAGYLPLQVLSSQGAVQTSGLQQNMSISGLHNIASVDAAAIMGGDSRHLRMFLETKDGVRPFLNGENHLVWQDGEPVDPFILALYADGENPGAAPNRLFRREIYNEGLRLLQMEPYQRLLSSRGPCGFDSATNVPDWAMTDDLRRALGPGFPISYLKARQISLIQQVRQAAAATNEDQATVDEIVSLAERLYLVAQPAGTTVGWLTALLHYGHTVSGAMDVEAGANPILTALAARTGLGLAIAPAGDDRDAPNARWLAAYTKGVMDTDAISDFVYGELYIPLAVTAAGPVSFSRQWRFAAEMAAVLAALATDFAKPFWGQFNVQGDSRTQTVTGIDPADPSRAVTLTDRLGQKADGRYTYTTDGFPGLTGFTGGFIVDVADGQARLAWNCSFTTAAGGPATTCLAWLAGTADTMDAALQRYFGPR